MDGIRRALEIPADPVAVHLDFVEINFLALRRVNLDFPHDTPIASYMNLLRTLNSNQPDNWLWSNLIRDHSESNGLNIIPFFDRV